MRTIKRYENRKLYDTTASAYVSLADLAALVRSGETVQVIDNATGDDITSATLTQVILDEGKRGQHLISSEFLHDLLRRSNRALDEGLGQLKTGVEGLVSGSVQRLQRIVQPTPPDEVAELRERLAQVEAVLQGLSVPSNPSTPQPENKETES